jgi:hypothetical protein
MTKLEILLLALTILVVVALFSQSAMAIIIGGIQ